ncbi:MAG: exonuclease domain-containing protein [Bacteroidota bacterium]|nr:exonuclease domain-containing protein [Bacteroidota bacterium]
MKQLSLPSMYAILDIETTGGSYKLEKITEIAIYIYDGEKIIDEFVSLVNPERGIPYFITKLTGITNEMVADAPKFYEIAKEVVEITKDQIFVAHNASFDYNFVKNEFRNLGYNFTRKHLCTVKLSRKLMPGFPSYSLGNLCERLKIEINGRHRAAGDALATVKLFEHLLELDTQGNISNKADRLAFRGLHQDFDKKIIEALPQQTGIYYFYNQEGAIIYIGKSNNIRKRIIQHLGNENSSRAIEMKGRIVDIGHEITGSELIALLLESDEIKRHKPVFNRAQRRTGFTNGIFYYKDQNDYFRLNIEKNRKKYSPLISFSSKEEGKKALFRMVEEFELCQKLCGLYSSDKACFHYGIGQCRGACIGKETPTDYNKRVQAAIDRFEFENSNFLIIDKGRSDDEKSVVCVENGCYIGFGYFAPEFTGDNLELIKDNIKAYSDNRDIQSIIRGYLKQRKAEKIIAISNHKSQ